MPGNASGHAAWRPVALTRYKMLVTETVAIAVPIIKSLPLLLAKIRIQKPETEEVVG